MSDGPAERRTRRPTNSTLSRAAAALGFALFLWTIYNTGPALIVQHVREIGLTFVLLMAVAAVRQVTRTLAWYYCIDAPYRGRISLLELGMIRLAGEAVTTVMVAGPVLGEAAKAVVAGRSLPKDQTVPSIARENLLYTISVALVIAAGAVVLLGQFALEPSALVAGEIMVAVAAGAAIAIWYVVHKRILVVGWLLDRARGSEPIWRRLGRVEDGVRGAEMAVIDLYAHERPRFMGILALELASALPGVIEAYLILGAFSGGGTWAIAFVVESVFRVINTIFGFIPLRVGVDEGGTALLLAALGIGATEGVSLAVIRKIRTLAWALPGLVLLWRYAIGREGDGPEARELAQDLSFSDVGELP